MFKINFIKRLLAVLLHCGTCVLVRRSLGEDGSPTEFILRVRRSFNEGGSLSKGKRGVCWVFFLLFLTLGSLNAFVRDFVESVKAVRINSIKQKIIDFNQVILEGEVEVLVDNKLHLWADKVEIDKEKQFLVAQCKEHGSVVIENNDFLILADKLFLDLDKKTGYADNIRIHVAEGYIKAGHAEKLGEKSWEMEDMLFTPCDAAVPHWSITAKRAKLYSNYIVKVSGVLFKAGNIPFFAVPTMAFPIQNRSKSGFLLPKFSYDDDLGFGIKEEFYWGITPRCDTTIGVDWREQNWLAFLDEFRWARSPESFTLVNSRYVFEKNAFVKKHDRILQKTDRRYWIEGKDFRSFSKWVPGINLDSLLRVDFGTDKKLGYQFFYDTKSVDDTFYNSWILRGSSKSDLVNISFDGSKTLRRQFLQFTQAQEKEITSILNYDFRQEGNSDVFSKKREIEDKVEIYKLPHIEWSSIYKNFGKPFFYRQDVFIDHIFSREQRTETFYVESNAVKSHSIIPLIKADSFRFFYRGDLRSSLNFKDQILQFYFFPRFDFRSNLKDSGMRAGKNVLEGRLFSQGVVRVFFECGAEWVFPENCLQSDEYDNAYYFQPIIKWDFLPKFKQDHWYYSDKWDRAYPKNRIGIFLKNNWHVGNMLIDFDVGQAYDFYSSSDIYPLRRCPRQTNLLPLCLDLGLSCDVLSFFISQQYNWKGFELLQNEISLNFSLNRFNLSLLTLYQDKKLRHERELLSDVPHSVIFSISVPILKNATISYNGQFYSQKNSQFFPFEGLRPLLHRISLDYQGHCWGICFGFEEKRYRQYGNWKSDRAFTLYVKLESLGSFARKFKRPTTYLK